MRRGAEPSVEFTVSKTLLPCLPKLTLAFYIMIVLWVKPCLLCLADLMDTITGPNKEFIPVLGSPEAPPPAMTVKTSTISPALPSEGRTISPVYHPNTAASYGLEQLESEGTVVSDHIFEKQISRCKFKSPGKLLYHRRIS